MVYYVDMLSAVWDKVEAAGLNIHYEFTLYDENNEQIGNIIDNIPGPSLQITDEDILLKYYGFAGRVRAVSGPYTGCWSELFPLGFPPVDPDIFILQCEYRGIQMPDIARKLHKKYWYLSYVDFTCGFALAGKTAEIAREMLLQEYPDLTAEQVYEAMSKAYPDYKGTVLDIAKKCFEMGYAPEEAAEKIIAFDPMLGAKELAGVMGKAGYGLEDAAKAVHFIFPNLQVRDQVEALKAAAQDDATGSDDPGEIVVEEPVLVDGNNIVSGDQFAVIIEDGNDIVSEEQVDEITKDQNDKNSEK
jgi:hypothetical protein